MYELSPPSLAAGSFCSDLGSGGGGGGRTEAARKRVRFNGGDGLPVGRELKKRYSSSKFTTKSIYFVDVDPKKKGIASSLFVSLSLSRRGRLVVALIWKRERPPSPSQ